MSEDQAFVMRDCCIDELVTMENRHTPGFVMVCPTCGNNVRRAPLGNGFEVVAALVT